MVETRVIERGFASDMISTFVNQGVTDAGSSPNLKLYHHRLNEPWNFDAQGMDSPQTLVIIFASHEYHQRQDIFDSLKKDFPTSHVLGCSSAGEIFQDTLSDKSLALVCWKFNHTELFSVKANVNDSADSFSAGQLLASKLTEAKPKLKGVFLLSDGLRINGSELVRGLQSAISKDIAIAGGLAGDSGRFKDTWLLTEGATQTKVVTAVGFYGDYIELSCASKGGWDIFGPERRVTRSTSNVLYELDGQPALELYKRYLGDLVSELPASALRFPLALKNTEREIVRTILSVDEQQQSLTFAGDVPQGSVVQLMRTNFDHLIDGAAEAASEFSTKAPGVSIAISCVGRRFVLGQRAEEELEATLEHFGQHSPQLGFYSYGEISSSEGDCCLHNQTMTLVHIVERDDSAPAPKPTA